MSGFWLVNGRASRWGEKKIHLAGGEAQDILGQDISRCFKARSHKYRGPLKIVTCKICKALHSKKDAQ